MCKMTDALHAYIGDKQFVSSHELRAFEAGYQAGHTEGIQAAMNREPMPIFIYADNRPGGELSEELKAHIQAAAFRSVAFALSRAEVDARELYRQAAARAGMPLEKDGQR